MTEEVIIEAPKQMFYIKLTSEVDMPTALAFAYKQDTTTEVDDETGEETVINVGDPYLVAYTREYSIDVIGVMHEHTGNMLTDDDGNEYPEMAPIDGWHVNVKLHGESEELRNLVEELDATNGVTPNSPSRGWL